MKIKLEELNHRYVGDNIVDVSCLLNITEDNGSVIGKYYISASCDIYDENFIEKIREQQFIQINSYINKIQEIYMRIHDLFPEATDTNSALISIFQPIKDSIEIN